MRLDDQFLSSPFLSPSATSRSPFHVGWIVKEHLTIVRGLYFRTVDKCWATCLSRSKNECLPRIEQAFRTESYRSRYASNISQCHLSLLASPRVVHLLLTLRLFAVSLSYLLQRMNSRLQRNYPTEKRA